MKTLNVQGEPKYTGDIRNLLHAPTFVLAEQGTGLYKEPVHSLFVIVALGVLLLENEIIHNWNRQSLFHCATLDSQIFIE